MGFNTGPGPSNAIPAGEDFVMREIRDLQRFVRELTPSIARSIQPTVARLDAADVAFAAQQATLTATVDDLAAAQATLATAVTNIAANLASINDLLTKVVKPQSIYATATNFAVSTTPGVKASQTITVPAGFTSAIVSVTARVYAINPNTTGGFGSGGDYLYCKASISAVSGLAFPLIVLGSDSSGINVAPYSAVLSGLTPGGTFVVSTTASTAYLAWAANVVNTAEISGSIEWRS